MKKNFFYIAAILAVAGAAGVASAKITKYRNPMDPTIFSDHPMKDSMGMDYIPVSDEGAEKGSGIAGKAGFTLSQERQQLIGVRTGLAELKPLTLTLRIPGRVISGGRVLAQLLEIDAGILKAGMKARIQGPQGKVLEATVQGVSGSLDPLTHSFDVTLAVAPAAWLKPGLFCLALVTVDFGRRLTVPQEAILDTGQRQVLFVRDELGHFEPREVVLGQAGDDRVEVLQGVKAGEQVVSSANFLIDSESRFQAALEKFQGSRP